jgi:hypothetical protein
LLFALCPREDDLALLDPGEDDGEADRVGEAEDLALLVEEGAEMVDLPLLPPVWHES